MRHRSFCTWGIQTGQKVQKLPRVLYLDSAFKEIRGRDLYLGMILDFQLLHLRDEAEPPLHRARPQLPAAVRIRHAHELHV